MPNCGCEYGEPCNFHAAEQDAADDIARDEAAVAEEIDEGPTQPIANVSMAELAAERLARLARSALAMMLVLSAAVSGCGTAGQPTPASDPLVGTWVRDDGYAMELRADGTAEIAGEGLTWYSYETADGTPVLDVLRGPVQYPATYTAQGDTLTLGTDGPLQEGTYHRRGAP